MVIVVAVKYIPFIIVYMSRPTYTHYIKPTIRTKYPNRTEFPLPSLSAYYS